MRKRSIKAWHRQWSPRHGLWILRMRPCVPGSAQRLRHACASYASKQASRSQPQAAYMAAKGADFLISRRKRIRSDEGCRRSHKNAQGKLPPRRPESGWKKSRKASGWQQISDGVVMAHLPYFSKGRTISITSVNLGRYSSSAALATQWNKDTWCVRWEASLSISRLEETIHKLRKLMVTSPSWI